MLLHVYEIPNPQSVARLHITKLTHVCLGWSVVSGRNIIHLKAADLKYESGVPGAFGLVESHIYPSEGAAHGSTIL